MYWTTFHLLNRKVFWSGQGGKSWMGLTKRVLKKYLVEQEGILVKVKYNFDPTLRGVW
jgi:hypothetical protein